MDIIPIRSAMDLREFLNGQSDEDLRNTFLTYTDHNMINGFYIYVTRYQDGFETIEYRFE